MNKNMLKALKGSIKKWEKMVNGTGVDGGKINCPLCQIHIDCIMITKGRFEYQLKGRNKKGNYPFTTSKTRLK